MAGSSFKNVNSMPLAEGSLSLERGNQRCSSSLMLHAATFVMGCNHFMEVTFMGLTLTEKEHWRERIARRIDQAISRLVSKDDPAFLSRTSEEARRLALQSLGLETLDARRVRIPEEQEALKQESDAVVKKMWEVVSGSAPEVAKSAWNVQVEVDRAIKDRAELHEHELLRQHPLGQRVEELRKEKEALLDTVWLATSGVQIKQLWNSVSKLLDEEPTRLQVSALAMNPEASTDSHGDT